MIRTIGRAIRIPRVIVLQIYDRLPRTKVRFSRLNIYARDDNTCQYCAQKLPRTVAQPRPRHPARAGRPHHLGERRLLLRAVQPARRARKRRTQAGMKLLRAPERPKWTPTFRAPGGKVAHREWLPFLGARRRLATGTPSSSTRSERARLARIGVPR